MGNGGIIRFMKKMLWGVGIVLAIVATPFLVGVGIGIWKVVTNQNLTLNAEIDCKNDMDCFSSNANTCRNAKVIARQKEIIKGVKQDVVLVAKQVENSEQQTVCRIFMGGPVHKDDSIRNLSASELTAVNNFLKSEDVAAANKRVDSCDYSKENWRYIATEMSTLADGYLLENPKAENCTALVKDISTLSPAEYESAAEGYRRLLKTGSSIQ